MFDIIIVSSDKDFNKLKYVYASLCRNIVDTYDNIYLISNKKYHLNDHVISYVDEDVLNIDRNVIRYRSNWVSQQYLKLFQGISKNDYYLVVDADIIFNKKIAIFENNKPIFFLGRDQNHEPYFRYSRKMLGLDKIYPHSFINEFMLFDKNVIEGILSNFNNDRFEFIRKSNEVIDGTCYISEYELYGNYVYEYFRDAYNYKHIKALSGGNYAKWEDVEIEKIMERLADSDYDVFTIHSWI